MVPQNVRLIQRQLIPFLMACCCAIVYECSRALGAVILDPGQGCPFGRAVNETTLLEASLGP